jgi:hypothetical protein
MPDASGRSLLTKTSSPSGKTPTPASPLLVTSARFFRESPQGVVFDTVVVVPISDQTVVTA